MKYLIVRRKDDNIVSGEVMMNTAQMLQVTLLLTLQLREIIHGDYHLMDLIMVEEIKLQLTHFQKDLKGTSVLNGSESSYSWK